MALRKPGPYAPLSAHYADDESIMAAGEDAELLYIRMLAYAARVPAAEGFISDAQLVSRLGITPRMTGNGTGIEPGTDALSRAVKLSGVGLIDKVEGGWSIRSWLKWNKSADEMGKERKRDRERKTSTDDGTRTGNDAGSRTGSHTGFRAPNTETKQNAETRQNADARTPRPRPAPAADEPTLVAEIVASGDSAFDDFWALYPKKVGKGAARTAWAKAAKRTHPRRIVEALPPLVAAWALHDPQFTPNPATWLNRDGWDDEPVPPPRGQDTRSLRQQDADRQAQLWKARSEAERAAANTQRTEIGA